MTVPKENRLAPSLSEQAVVHPTAWRLLEWPGNERRLVLVMPDGEHFRLTSMIVAVDSSLSGVAFTTSSGRRYEVVDEPVDNEIVKDMLHARAEKTKPGGLDVSEEFWASLGRKLSGAGGPRVN